MTPLRNAAALALASASFFAITDTAMAQSATETILVKENGGVSQVSEGDYYTQIQLNIDKLDLPKDDKGQKNFGRALLRVLGLGDKTRAITVTATLNADGTAMPEIPLITYYFDGSRKLTNGDIIDGYLSPRWNLKAGTPINITLRYRYVENTTYNPNFLKDGVGKLIPSSSVVKTLSGPFVGGVSDLAASVFEAAGSRETNFSVTNPLYPYSTGAAGSRNLAYTIQVPGQGAIGKIEAVMLVSPSLGRSPDYLSEAKTSDLQPLSRDDPGRLSISIRGTEVNLLDDIQSLPAYTEMKSAISRDSVSAFCNKARSQANAYGLTRMDRNNLIYRSMLDAQFIPGKYREDANDWMTVCFNSEADRAYLKAFRKVDFALPDPPIIVDRTAWPSHLKWAMGCVIRREVEVGPGCSANAQDASGVLRNAMSDTVKVGFIALSGIDQTLIPDDRMTPKTQLIEILTDKVDGFSCFAKSLVLEEEGGQKYFLNVKYENNLIAELSILKAPDGFFCTG